jgi:hypothetical protein
MDQDEIVQYHSEQEGLIGNSTGPVTDYSASVLHWMRDRAPNYRGGYTGERERPSASYIVDVRNKSTFEQGLDQ